MMEKPMARKQTNPCVGSDFEDFLAEERRLEEATAASTPPVGDQGARTRALHLTPFP